MFFSKLFNIQRKCSHDKITPDKEISYCPDCGKLIQNEWYITRCSCCGVKLKTKCRHDEILPQDNFCSNCGSRDFLVEKLKKINFIDINYAVLVKKEIQKSLDYAFTTQCWQEKTNEKPLLLIESRQYQH